MTFHQWEGVKPSDRSHALTGTGSLRLGRHAKRGCEYSTGNCAGTGVGTDILAARKNTTLVNIFTDGLKTNKAAGWAVRGIHAGQVLFQFNIPFARRASSHDAEMMALAHASKLVAETMLGKRSIREFRFFSDSTSALTSIFDPRPHPSQQASLLFQSNMHHLFSERKDITGRMLYGHGASTT